MKGENILTKRRMGMVGKGSAGVGVRNGRTGAMRGANIHFTKREIIERSEKRWNEITSTHHNDQPQNMALLPPRKSARTPSFLPRFVIPLVVFSLAILVLFEVDDLASQTKTIVGHNLDPTPWHIFPPRTFDNASKIAQTSKIIQCSYLSCGIGSGYSDVRFTRKSDDCPDFYRWIHHDLEPWSHSKISLAHLMAAKEFASFRAVIVSGKLYVEYYYDCVQSRAMFTIWGLLQLLKRYPGRVPDVDLMFDCMDKPIINRTEHAAMPLPLFRYCTTPDHFDIPFPDWSFWGWSEINIEPWITQFESIRKGSRFRSWKLKWPFAYWKGNPDVVSPIREALLQCNDTQQWGAQILRQNWTEEVESGFKKSKLSAQCNHRYKIYAEGYAWSVSLKYILSCGSLPLIIAPKYEDFFSRGLFPKKNYWPISPFDMCRSIKFAVDWGNQHPFEAEAIGKAAQDFMGSLNMDRIYDYMFHLLTEYSKLLDFKPVRPPSSVVECSASLLCFADKHQREFLEKSISSPSISPPCKLPPPDSHIIENQIEEKRKIMDEAHVIG